MDKFHIFEAIRKSKQKGGSMLGVHMDLHPVLVKEYSDMFELLVVEVTVGNTPIRVMTGYGPQEGWDEQERLPFFEALECEIASAELVGKSVIISMDANSKLGTDYIAEDPHGQSKNGKLLADIMDRHALIVLNGLKEKCQGLITREKHTVDGIERSVIDFVIMSSDLIKHIEYIHIDDKRKNVLTKLVKKKGISKSAIKMESDHNIIITSINISWNVKVTKSTEVFNFKDKKSQDLFFQATDKNDDLQKIFHSNKSIEVQTKKFIKRLNGFIHQSFKKVRISDKSDKELENLYNTRNYLRNRSDVDSELELEKIDNELSDKYSQVMYNKIKKEIKVINSDVGGFNPGNLWKLKQKLAPRFKDPPTAMKDADGKLLTTDEEVRKEAMKHYKNVFDYKPIDEEFKVYEMQREKLCDERLEKAYINKTPAWTVADVRNAIKGLNMGISQDPYGHPNEIFKYGVAGDGLISAVTTLMNKLKDNPKDFPTVMSLCNVTSIYKNKGDRNVFDSHRGVFRTVSLRNIMDRLMYNDEYGNVDNNLTDCNVGSRKKRNVRDNLFVMNAIMNSSKKGTDVPCDICVYDVKKCFDSLWLKECINDLYEAGFTNDKLCLLYYANKSAQIVIKTPNGNTERFSIYNTVMQGTVWAGLMCTCTMDKLGKIAYSDSNILYKYRNEVMVPPLQMVDDIITASECGNQVVTTNSVVNTFLKLKKLTPSETKCARIHVGKNNKCDKCPNISVNKLDIKESEKEKYLGDYLTKHANPKSTIEDRKSKGYAILSELRAILKDIPLGNKRFEIGLTLREAWFLNGTLFNSEVWCAYMKSDLQPLQIIDNKIMRLILGAHKSVPTELLYLETGTIPIINVITVRRLCYLQNILKRHKEEVIRRVYIAQKKNPIKGDWVQMIEDDMKNLQINVSDANIADMSEYEFKKLIKNQIRQHTFTELLNSQLKHKKGSDIKYTNLCEPQGYLTDQMFNNKLCSLLFNLRCNTVSNIKDNFHRLYNDDLNCPICKVEVDTQQHMLSCSILLNNLDEAQKKLHETTCYEDIYSNTQNQFKITTLFHTLLKIRQKMLDYPAYQGINTGPLVGK